MRLNRLRAARPPTGHIVLGAAVWALQMAGGAILSLYLRNRLQTQHVAEIASLFFAGGLLSWPISLCLGRFLAHGRPLETRFAGFFLALSLGTVLMTAFLFAMEYRLFYAQWHAAFGTLIWGFQFLFTGANALYQFTALGLRLFLPFGLVFLAATSLWLARRMR